MASASLKKTTFLSQKLTFLKDQGDQLNSAVGLFINGIIATAESWTEGGDNTMGFQELYQMIETATLFLFEKYEELAGASVGAAANQLSQPSCEQPDTSSQPITATTCYRQPAAPLTATANTSRRQPTELVQPADEIPLKPVLARIAVIEEAVSSFRSNAEKVAEQQSVIDQQLKEILSKLLDSDKKHNSRLRKVKEQISEISDTQVALDQEHETRLQSLEKQLQKLSTAQDRMEVEMESQAELTEKLVHVPDQLESVNEKLDVLDARIGRIIDDCSNKHQDIENVTRDLADKVMTNTEAAQVISEGQDQKSTLLKELDSRVQTLETESGRNMKDLQKQAEKGETNLRILCQMLNDRLTPLEQLKTSLNQRISVRDNIEKLSHVIQEVAVMSPRIQQLEVKSSRTRCGFTACKTFSEATGRDTIGAYDTLDCNVGGNFDGGSGIFTAPVDGLYVTSVSVYIDANEYVGVAVRHNKQGQGGILSSNVCFISANVKHTTACTVGVVDMKAGDMLSSYVVYNISNNYKQFEFSCFLLT